MSNAIDLILLVLQIHYVSVYLYWDPNQSKIAKYLSSQIVQSSHNHVNDEQVLEADMLDEGNNTKKWFSAMDFIVL